MPGGHHPQYAGTLLESAHPPNELVCVNSWLKISAPKHICQGIARLKLTSLSPLSNTAWKRSSVTLVFRDSYLSTRRILAVVEATGVRPVNEQRGWIGRVNRRTDVALGYGLRPLEAAVVRGMVLGDRSLIPEDLEEYFQRSGITHVTQLFR